MKRIGLFLAITVLGALPVSAQATATASALIAQGLVVTETVQLNFGDFAAGGGGSVSIAPAGALTSVSSVPSNPLIRLGGTVTAGRFRVFNIGMSGTRRFTFTISTPSILISNGSGAGPDYEMVIDTFTTDAPSCPPCARTQNSNGHEVFINVGATLRVKPSQAAGTYVGTYFVRVDEQ